jgi:hypothetical protein
VPNAVFVDTSDVAAYLVECAFDGIRGMRSEIGGPEDLSCTKFARQYQERREVHRPVFAVRVSESTARGMGFAVAKGRRGALRWSEWLALSERVVPGRGRQKVRDQVAPKQR